MAGINNSANPFELEVCLFGANSIYDGFNDDPYNQNTLAFARQLFEFISSKSIDDYVLAKAGLVCIYEMAKVLIEI